MTLKTLKPRDLVRLFIIAVLGALIAVVYTYIFIFACFMYLGVL